MQQAIQDFVACRRIAVVGVSRSGKKFGNTALAELRQRGYEVYAVHPSAQEIAGERCYPGLAALKGKVDGVLVCVPPAEATRVVGEAAEAGLRHVWLQQGAESAEALERARGLGINAVAGKCILMYAQPVRSFHKWHRAFNGLFGKL